MGGAAFGRLPIHVIFLLSLALDFTLGSRIYPSVELLLYLVFHGEQPNSQQLCTQAEAILIPLPKALKGLIRPLRALGPYKALKSLVRPFKAL